MSKLVKKIELNLEAIRILKENEVKNTLDNISDNKKIELLKYSGFGGCQRIFSDSASKSEKEAHDKLLNILDEIEYKSIKNTIIDAHYTPESIIKLIWNSLKKKGFKGGKILEPSSGVGRFLSYQSEDLYKNSEWTCSEVDKITGRICSALHPNAIVNLNGFQDICALDNEDKYDLVISNFPFGNTILYDRKYNLYKENIHNYFLEKSLALAKDGGLVIALTSSGLLNSPSNHDFRLRISKNNKLLCAAFLNDRTFSESEVSCILVVFQKGLDSTEQIINDFVELENIDIDSSHLPLNNYFIKNKNHILGKLSEDKLFGNRLSVSFDSEIDSLNKLENILENNIPDNIYKENIYIKDKSSLSYNLPFSLRNSFLNLYKTGEYIHHDSDLYLIKINKVEQLRLSKGEIEFITPFLNLKQTTLKLFNAEMNGENDSIIEELRKELNENYSYIGFLKELPITTNRKIRKFIGDDPYFPMLCALEIEDAALSKTTGKREFIKADIFHKRTINFIKQPEIKNIHDAILISLRDKGEIDLHYCAGLMDKDTQEIEIEFNESNNIFFDPSINKYVINTEYLSGNVREKLIIARNFGMEKNILALISVQPKLLFPNCYIDPKNYERLKDELSSEIAYGENFCLRLGSPIISVKTLTHFICELLDEYTNKIDIRYNKILATYAIKASTSINHSVLNKYTHGLNENCTAVDILESILNSRQLKFYKQINTEVFLDEEKTAAARKKCEDMIFEFNEWLWKSQERIYEYTYKYNLKYNNIVNPKYSGEHLNIPNTSEYYKLRDYQKNAIWRIIKSPTTLINHAVGTGKTITMVGATMELRRLGLCKKPMIACLKANRESIGVEFLRMYPFAKILVPSESDFKKENRVKLFARIATNDWDCVIITHEFLRQIPVDNEILNKCVSDKIEELNIALESFASNKNEEKINARIISNIQKSLRSYEQKQRSLYDSDSKDKGITFEQMGIDALFVDEAQYFKSLEVHTKMQNVKGLSTNSASKRASDLETKIYSIRNSGGKVVFATGTPIMNTMVETFILLKYLYPEALAERDIEHFDAFAGMFIHIENSLEIKQTGRFENVTRAKKFYNLPELLSIFNHFTDSKQIADTDIKLPKSSDIPVMIPPSKPYIEFLEKIAKRAEFCKSNPQAKKKDNFLKIGNDGKLASLDMRLVTAESPRTVNSKVSQCAIQIMHMYHITEHFKGVQLVFSDRGTPKPSGIFSVYQELKYLLIEMGAKENEIAFIQDIEKDKESFFKKVRDGSIRIVIGSTAKLGVGVNVQDVLVAEHHLDMPYRPADYDQRLGRMNRFGNTCSNVFNFIYITQGVKGKNTGFDSWSFQTLKAKKAFIDSFLYNSETKRESSDIDEKPMTHAELMALATGDDLILKKTFIENKITNLNRERRGFEQNQQIILDKLNETNSILEVYPNRISELKKYIISIGCKSEDFCKEKNFKIKLINNIYEDRKDAAIEMENIVQKNSSFEFGEIGGLKLLLEFDRGEKYIKIGSSPYLNTFNFKFNLKEVIEDDFKNTSKLINTSIIGRIRKFDSLLETFIQSFNKAESDVNILKSQINLKWDKLEQLHALKEELRLIEEKYKESEEELNAISEIEPTEDNKSESQIDDENKDPNILVEVKMDSEIDSEFVDSDFFFISRLSSYPEPEWVENARKIFANIKKKRIKKPIERTEDYDYASLFNDEIA